jgi:hypothetical protein
VKTLQPPREFTRNEQGQLVQYVARLTPAQIAANHAGFLAMLAQIELEKRKVN